MQMSFSEKSKRSLLDHMQGTISTRYGIQIVDQLPVAHVVLHPIIQMVEMMQSSHSDTMYIRLESLEEPTTSHVHTITPDAELLAPAPPTIHHTIENPSIQTNQQFTTQQIPQENDVESLETIRQSIERFSLPSFTGYRESENLYDSDSDRDNTTCHMYRCIRFAPLIPSSPDVPTTSIVPSTSTVHWSTEVPATPRTTSVVNRTAEAPKKDPLVIKPRMHMFISYMRAIANLTKDGYSPKTKWLDIKYLFGM
ncbi:hypothetical protein V8E54_004372 [Elaphomyces granulatus]